MSRLGEHELEDAYGEGLHGALEPGWGGIRTLVTDKGKHAFQACAIDHSATHPE